MYVFWLETNDGERIEWRRLSKSRAEAMYSATDRWMPENVKRYGWEKAK